jgi:hypothetical protein
LIRQLIRENGEHSRFLFLSERKAPLSIDGAQKLIERLGEAARLPFLIHAHMLRHSAGYALAGRGVDTRTLQTFMGHRSIANTVIYTAVADKRIRHIWELSLPAEIRSSTHGTDGGCRRGARRLQTWRSRELFGRWLLGFLNPRNFDENWIFWPAPGPVFAIAPDAKRQFVLFCTCFHAGVDPFLHSLGALGEAVGDDGFSA